ncbi:chitin synthesis regulation, resistance to congo red-domain-containing protein [Xylaria sp. CBS 124048]|nr:chitin synthesis regulation, resistance to congo red-domain-containing protein [Xylaria sp. CBS 124048]
MAPVLDQVSSALQKRFGCPVGSHFDGFRCVRDSTWHWYGRWILAAIVLGLFFVFIFLYACLKSRRRRRQGMRPMYGTGWMAPNNGQYHNNGPQASYNDAYRQPPPAYGAPGQAYPMNNQFQNTPSNYNQQASGVEPPKNVYTGDYAPPAGPPPNK